MSAWPGKFVIGLTGNIATGKSVVRKMLEHLGACGINADALAHRAMAQNAPGYQPVIETFGKYVLASDGQIDRARLGKVVFSDPEALKQLESIVHPLVIQAVNILVRRSPKKVAVIEAIKLLESGLADMCDSIWVAYAPMEQQLARLMSKRGLSEAVALQRISAQTPQDQKMACADVVIRNEGTYEDTWRQVAASWSRLFPTDPATQPENKIPIPKASDWMIERARPHQVGEIADFISRFSEEKNLIGADEVMADFGEKAFLLLRMGGQLCAIAGYEVENLVSCTSVVCIDDSIDIKSAIRALISEVERAANELQCEISLLFPSNQISGYEDLFAELGYLRQTVDGLAVQAWREAALEPAGNGMLYFKQLRKDRILRPV
jgi:dephospho-CoA kinase